jgi:hypothetical protein
MRFWACSGFHGMAVDIQFRDFHLFGVYSCVLVKLLLHKGDGSRSQWPRRRRRRSVAATEIAGSNSARGLNVRFLWV